MRTKQQTFERGSEFLRSGRAWEICLRQYHLIDKAPKRLEKASMILVTHHPKDKDHWTGRMRSIRTCEEIGQNSCSSRIMRAIQQDCRMVIDHF
jgi:hypothetical protein